MATVRSNISGPLPMVLYATIHNTEGQTVYMVSVSIMARPDGYSTNTLAIAGFQHGTYNASIFATTQSGVAVSKTATVEFSI